jgi:hypothetical protein
MSRLTRFFPVRWASSAVALAGVAVLLAPAAQAAAAPDDGIASAAYAKAEIWLQRKPSDHKQRELVFQATPDSAPQVLDVAVPQRDTRFPSEWSERLALGLDRAGRLAAVVTSRTGLYWTRVKHAPKLHRVPGTTKADSFPSIFRGRLAYDHQPRAVSSVRVGSLTDGATRTAWTNRSDTAWAAVDTAIGADGAVAFVIGADGAEEALYDAKLVRPDGRVVDVWPGDHHDGVLSLEISTSGRRLTVAGPTVWHYALPSGRRLR